MFHRAMSVTFAGALLVAPGGIASAAVPNDGAQSSDKPVLYRASPMINDPVMGTQIRGKAPADTNMIRIPKDDVQANLPDLEKLKHALDHASPMINDPLVPGKAPTGTNMAPNDDIQAGVPTVAKPPLYRASPMINDPATTIHGAAPAKAPQ